MGYVYVIHVSKFVRPPVTDLASEVRESKVREIKRRRAENPLLSKVDLVLYIARNSCKGSYWIYDEPGCNYMNINLAGRTPKVFDRCFVAETFETRRQVPKFEPLSNGGPSARFREGQTWQPRVPKWINGR